MKGSPPKGVPISPQNWVRMKHYKDTLHGFEAYATGLTQAWMLIRNACHENQLKVPTMNKIKEIES